LRFFRALLLAASAACAALAQDTLTSRAVTVPMTANTPVPVAVTAPALVNPDVSGATVPEWAQNPYPSYFLSFGGGYTRNAQPQAAAGFVSAAIGLGGGNYSITTIDMTSLTSTIRTGFGKVLAQSGNFILLARVDAGISTVNPVIGSFSGGGILMYNLKGFSSKLDGIYTFGEVRILGATATTVTVPNQVTPGLYFGFGKSF